MFVSIMLEIEPEMTCGIGKIRVTPTLSVYTNCFICKNRCLKHCFDEHFDATSNIIPHSDKIDLRLFVFFSNNEAVFIYIYMICQYN